MRVSTSKTADTSGTPSGPPERLGSADALIDGAFELVFLAVWETDLYKTKLALIELHGTFEGQVRIAEEYLAPFGKPVRDKVMYKNALKFYKRHRSIH